MPGLAYGRDMSTMGESLLVSPGQAPLLARPCFADGDPGPIAAALAQVPELMAVALPFLGTLYGPSALTERTKEIVVVRTSALARCEYCVQTHTVVALDAGLTRDEVRALRGDLAVPERFDSARERTLLSWTDAVAGAVGPVDERVLAAFRAEWAPHEVVEVTALIGATLMLNRFATALRLPTSTEALDRLTAAGLR